MDIYVYITKAQDAQRTRGFGKAAHFKGEAVGSLNCSNALALCRCKTHEARRFSGRQREIRPLYIPSGGVCLSTFQ